MLPEDALAHNGETRGEEEVPASYCSIYDSALGATVLTLLFHAIACPTSTIHTGTQTTTPPLDNNGPHKTAEEYLALAEKLGVEGSSQAELEVALEALERVEGMNGPQPELLAKELRIVYLIASPISIKRARVAQWLERGGELARRVIKVSPDRVEGHYYRAIFLGFEAQSHKLRALDLLPKSSRQVKEPSTSTRPTTTPEAWC